MELIGFEKITIDNVLQLKKYFALSNSKMCDLSVGDKYMWRNNDQIHFKIFNNTLICYEVNNGQYEFDSDKGIYFLFPLGENVDLSLKEINRICLENKIVARFKDLNLEQVNYLQNFYKNYTLSDFAIQRSDYLYLIEEMRTFKGKHLSGKRSSLHKFLKLYPEAKFKIATEHDIDKLVDFYNYEENILDFKDLSQKEEYEKSIDLIKNFKKLNLVCGYIDLNNKIIGYAIGEIVNDVLIDMVEKCLRNYDGVYQFLVNNFTNACGENCTYFNREEDLGEEGLRESKKQYYPCLMVNKYFLKVCNNIALIDDLPTLEIEKNLSLVSFNNKEEYLKLVFDKELNKLFGYNYLDDYPNGDPNKIYQGFLNDKLNKKEMSYAIVFDNVIIGEIILYNFKMTNILELGIRIKSEYQHRQIGFKCMSYLVNYLLEYLRFNGVLGRALLENKASYNLFNKLSFVKYLQDDKFYYFIKTEDKKLLNLLINDNKEK